MKRSRTPQDMDRRFRAIGAILSARLAPPAIVLVTAASTQDDTSVLAHGLATSFHAAGFRTAYAGPADLARTTAQRPSYDAIALADPGGDIVAAEIEALVARWRDAYEIVLYDVPAILDDRRAIRVARHLDGILIALHGGRAITRDDADVATFLATLTAPNLGVVTTGRRTTPSGSEPVAAAGEQRSGARAAYSRA
jgi:hypothetical protein